MSNTQVMEIGKKLVEMCRAGKPHEAMAALYAKDIVSMEAGAPPGQQREAKGLAACEAKGKMFFEMHEIHGQSVEGPFPHDDRFAVYFDYDITNKQNKQRFHMKEVALYWVKDGKIVREEFYYGM
jgi:ketosteroid isomerase-like protein|nr:nuclear transport factor 2 family protein [Kofleriaceae bacterium]